MLLSSFYCTGGGCYIPDRKGKQNKMRIKSSSCSQLTMFVEWKYVIISFKRGHTETFLG